MYKLTEDQIKQTAKLQEEFLKNIFPFLKEKNFHNECIELRPISRTKGKYIRSLNLWRFDDKGKEEHLKFITKVNGQPFCLYYSLFTLNYDKECKSSQSKKYEKGKINKQNSMYTQVLAMDFDNIIIADHTKYIKLLSAIGIESITIYTGHGFQNLILLNEKIYDKQILKKFTYLLLSRGFPVDNSIIDSSRVFRIPGSFNCKEFDESSDYFNHDPQGIPVKIITQTNKRYSINYIFDKIESLEVKDLKVVNKYIELKEKEKEDKIVIIDNNKNKKINHDILKFKSIEEEYNMLHFKKLPEAIQNMFRCTKENYRNSVMLFLIPFLSNKLGLSLNIIIDIMKVWGRRCEPSLEPSFVEKEVKRIYGYSYKGTGAYTTDLAKKFGYIAFEKYQRKNEIQIPNEFIENYNILHDGSIKIYYMMKLFEIIEEISQWTRQDICRVANISSPTFTRNIKDLVSLGYIDVKKDNKINGSFKYYINKYYNKSKGYTKFETATIENMVYNRTRSLTNGEIKLYTFFCKMTGEVKECYASQLYIAEAIGKKRNSISEMTDSLRDKKYIKKDSYVKDYVEHCTYTLNY